MLDWCFCSSNKRSIMSSSAFTAVIYVVSADGWINSLQCNVSHLSECQCVSQIYWPATKTIAVAVTLVGCLCRDCRLSDFHTVVLTLFIACPQGLQHEGPRALNGEDDVVECNGDPSELTSRWIIGVDASVSLTHSEQTEEFNWTPTVVGRVRYHFGLWFAAHRGTSLLAISSPVACSQCGVGVPLACSCH